MRKYFYFRSVADEADDDDQAASIAIPVDAITGITPQSIDSIEVYFDTKTITTGNYVRIGVTRGFLQEVMQELVAHINGYGHNKAPMKVMCDKAETTVNASSIEGDDIAKSAIYFSDHVTDVELV